MCIYTYIHKETFYLSIHTHMHACTHTRTHTHTQHINGQTHLSPKVTKYENFDSIYMIIRVLLLLPEIMMITIINLVSTM